MQSSDVNAKAIVYFFLIDKETRKSPYFNVGIGKAML